MGAETPDTLVVSPEWDSRVFLSVRSDNTLLTREARGDAQGGQRSKTQEDIMELTEQVPLEGLGKEISKHMVHLTITEGNVICVKAVSDEEITNVDVPRPLAGRCMPVSFKPHHTLVVLFKITVMEGKTLIQFPPKMDENWLRYELVNW